MTFTVAVVSAGLSQPSSTRLLADRLSAAVVERAKSAGHDVLVEVVELRPLARALADNLTTGFPGPELEAAVSTVTDADALVAVTPVFTASYSGLFKTFFDVLDKEALTGKPTLIGATAGTARHSLVLEHAMRPLFAYLRAVVVPTAVFAATEDFGDTGGNHLAERVERAAGELVDLLVPRPASARTSSRTPRGTTRSASASTSSVPTSSSSSVPSEGDPFDDVTPFEELLRRNP